MFTNAIFLAVVFLSVLSVGLVVSYYATPDLFRERLQRFAPRVPAPEPAPGGGWVAKIVKLSGPLAKLSLPDEGWEHSPLRIRFMNAGLRGSSIPLGYFSAKTVLAIGLPLLWFLMSRVYPLKMPPAALMASFVLLAGIGYYIPNAVLSHRIAARQREIFDSFPDAIDLMTVCVEAGLGLDAAIVRVADEIQLTSPTLAEEMHLVMLELRAGSPKETALRNLALRTGVEEVDALVAMLIQADRFGTSIADSLRVHADSLRTKRRQRAEEAAAKIPVKLLFPLIFCIFPSMLLVLMGPSMLRIFKVLLPAMKG